MYLGYAGPLTFYTVACAHDLNLMMCVCMFMGRYRDAIDTANKMCRLLSKDVLSVKGRPKFTMSLEGYYSMKTHVMVRFGRWQEIIDEPPADDPDLYPVTRAMQHYGKGIAYATMKQFDEADEERLRFQSSLQRIPRERQFFNNSAPDILAVGAKMLDGEMEYHKGNYDAAFAHLRESVRLDDNLEYIEPWAWMHPPRHALAALLMEQGHFGEAEEVYRDDLGLSGQIQRCAQHPDNVWALHGLVECLQRRNEQIELPALQKSLAAALAMADVPITSSCMCRAVVQASSDCCCTSN
jgi:tetratricopeptide (TPR) repeat protein